MEKKDKKLELSFLMNVALYLESAQDVKNFIQVNKKALEIIKRLKVNPFFSDIGIDLTQNYSAEEYMKK